MGDLGEFMTRNEFRKQETQIDLQHCCIRCVILMSCIFMSVMFNDPSLSVNKDYGANSILLGLVVDFSYDLLCNKSTTNPSNGNKRNE